MSIVSSSPSPVLTTPLLNALAVRFRGRQELAGNAAPGDGRKPAPRFPWREDASGSPQGLRPTAYVSLTIRTGGSSSSIN
jgi:hypothetical protein